MIIFLMRGGGVAGKTTFSKKLTSHLVNKGIKKAKIARLGLDNYFYPVEVVARRVIEDKYDNVLNFDLLRAHQRIQAVREGSEPIGPIHDHFSHHSSFQRFGSDEIEDCLSTYCGMRKVSVVNLTGTYFPYIALNNKPIYLQLTLGRSYHAEGSYTFPSDNLMPDEILYTRRIDLILRPMCLWEKICKILIDSEQQHV
jgi:hypothetical protein